MCVYVHVCVCVCVVFVVCLRACSHAGECCIVLGSATLRSQVPIVKFRDKMSNLWMDISFNQPSGPQDSINVKVGVMSKQVNSVCVCVAGRVTHTYSLYRSNILFARWGTCTVAEMEGSVSRVDSTCACDQAVPASARAK